MTSPPPLPVRAEGWRTTLGSWNCARPHARVSVVSEQPRLCAWCLCRRAGHGGDGGARRAALALRLLLQLAAVCHLHRRHHPRGQPAGRRAAQAGAPGSSSLCVRRPHALLLRVAHARRCRPSRAWHSAALFAVHAGEAGGLRVPGGGRAAAVGRRHRARRQPGPNGPHLHFGPCGARGRQVRRLPRHGLPGEPRGAQPAPADPSGVRRGAPASRPLAR